MRETVTVNEESGTESDKRRMYLLHGCLVIPVGSDIGEGRALQLGSSILERIEDEGVKKAIIDLSDVPVLDSKSFAVLCRIGRMIKLMGASVIFTGFLPGVASALVELDADTDSITTSSTVEEGMALLNNMQEEAQ